MHAPQLDGRAVALPCARHMQTLTVPGNCIFQQIATGSVAEAVALALARAVLVTPEMVTA